MYTYIEIYYMYMYVKYIKIFNVFNLKLIISYLLVTNTILKLHCAYTSEPSSSKTGIRLRIEE